MNKSNVIYYDSIYSANYSNKYWESTIEMYKELNIYNELCRNIEKYLDLLEINLNSKDIKSIDKCIGGVFSYIENNNLTKHNKLNSLRYLSKKFAKIYLGKNFNIKYDTVITALYTAILKYNKNNLFSRKELFEGLADSPLKLMSYTDTDEFIEMENILNFVLKYDCKDLVSFNANTVGALENFILNSKYPYRINIDLENLIFILSLPYIINIINKCKKINIKYDTLEFKFEFLTKKRKERVKNNFTSFLSKWKETYPNDRLLEGYITHIYFLNYKEHLYD